MYNKLIQDNRQLKELFDEGNIIVNDNSISLPPVSKMKVKAGADPLIFRKSISRILIKYGFHYNRKEDAYIRKQIKER